MTTSTPTQKQKTWIVAHDFSACADAAATLAMTDLANGRRASTLVLLHVFQLPLPMNIEGFPVVQNFTDIEGAMRSEAKKRLEVVAGRLRALHQQVSAAEGAAAVDVVIVVTPGLPAVDIVAEAVTRHAERIIVGTHGRRGLGRAFLGSVAERVVRTAPMPVLVVHDEHGH